MLIKSNIIPSHVSSTSPSSMSYSAEFPLRAGGSYALHRHTKYSCVYTLRDVLKIRDGIISDFYPRLPHIDLEMATQ